MVAIVLGELIAYGDVKTVVCAFILMTVWCVSWTLAVGEIFKWHRIFFGILIVISGYLLMHSKINGFMEIERSLENVKSVELSGIILKVSEGEENSVYTAKVCGLGEKVILYVSGDAVAYPGCIFKMSGKYMEYTGARNQGNFDDRKYYMSENIAARFTCNKFEITGDRNYIFRKNLYRIKSTVHRNLYKLYSEKNASIYSAMILGNKNEMDENVKELYKTAGIYHLACISGTHMSFIGIGVYGLLRKRHKYVFSGIFGMIAVVMYGILTGMGVSVVRSVIMLVIRMTGDILGRSYDMITSMSIAAIIMIIINPMVILNSGFIMSFGAIASICIILPEVEKFYSVKKKGFIKAFICSLVIQICTLPAVAFFYYEVSVYGFILNIILVPGMVYVLVSGFASVCMSFINLSVGKFVAGTGNLCLAIYEKICVFVSKLPLSEYVTGRPDIIKIMLYYVIIIILVAAFRKLKNKDREFYEENWYVRYVKIAMGAGTVLIVCAIIFLHLKRNLTIKYIDVGQGDSIYVHMENDVSYLIDGGSSDLSDVGTYRILPVLMSDGVDELDYVIVTHTDSDHINGLSAILSKKTGKRNYVKNLVLPDIYDKSDEKFIELEEIAKINKINIIYISAGDKWRTDEYVFECLYPDINDKNTDKNELSVVLKLYTQDVSMLFTGDMGKEEEEKISGKAGKCHILKVGHHGSKGSSSEEFLDEVKPDIAIISSGENNSYGHPHSETIKRLENEGAKIYNTAYNGQITLVKKAKKFEIDCYLK